MRMRKVRRWRVAVALGAVLALGAGPTAQVARAQQHAAERVLSGVVKDDAGKPVKDAVVYLKDLRTQSVKSCFTGEDGSYRFVQLTATTDYEVWAESAGRKSKTRNISSFDTKSQFTIDLKF